MTRCRMAAVGALLGSVIQAQAEAGPRLQRALLWEGAYIGFQFGYGFAGQSIDEIIRIGGPKGSLVGIRAGWNLEMGRLVMGFSADISHSLIGQSFLNARGNLPWVASVTARLGYAVTPSTLVYGLTGPTFGRGQIRFPGFSMSHNHIGLTVGGGIEQRVGSAVSVYAEYRYVGLLPKPYSPLPLKLGYEGHVALIGINFRLN